MPGGNKPWNSIAPSEELYSPKGMIGPEERRSLYWIGKEYFSGRGAIIDAGAFIGASAFCLAAGLHANPRPGVVRSYDYFRAIDTYVVDYISREVRPIKEGGNYLDVFLTQTARYRDLIKHEAGDFLTKHWTGEPIEVLFIDIAKTQDLNSHIIREFFPHLIPGRSLVVHQDFYHCWHPYIHVTMEALSPYFEILDEHIEYGTRLYLYAKPMPSGVIAAVADYTYSAEDRIALLDALSAKEIGRMRAMIEVVKLRQLAMDGDAAALLKQHASIIATYGQVRIKDLWWRQTHEVMADYEKYHHTTTSSLMMSPPDFRPPLDVIRQYAAE